MKPEDARYIDEKLDDGIASSGKVFSYSGGGASATTCLDNNDFSNLSAGAANYNLNSSATACVTFYHVGL